MSSNIPTRRATRATRLPDENALKGRAPAARGLAKPTAIAPPPAAGSSKTVAGPPTLDANIQNKRKREAFGEVTNANKNKNVPQGISKDGKLVKPHVLVPPKPIRPTVKVPLRKTRAGTTLTKEVEVQNEVEEDAMAVDEPAPATSAPTLHRVTRRISTRTIAATTVTTEASGVQHLTTRSQTVDQLNAEVNRAVEEVPEPDTEPVAKRRRTSSEADVEAAVEEGEDEDEQEPPAEVVSRGLAELGTYTNVLQPEGEDEEEEVTGWDDLDKDDIDDPFMVSEYVVDIIKYLHECEVQSLANPNYMQHQQELRWSHRGVLMDYIIGLHSSYRMCAETLYLAVNIIDRFLSMRVVSLSKLQLVGLTGLCIAAKFEEVIAPTMSHLLTAGAMEDTKEEDMLKAERYILKTLNWSISLFPQPLNWLRRITKADDYDPDVRSLAKFFLEMHVVERRLLGVKPSLIAAASIWLGRLIRGKFGWTPNLAHYSGYSEKKIMPVANIMLNYCLRPEKHENFIRKYSSKKFVKVAVYINNWVTGRWTMGEKISLADELPYLTALAHQETSD